MIIYSVIKINVQIEILVLKKNENIIKSNMPDLKNYINFKEKICFNKNYKKK